MMFDRSDLAITVPGSKTDPRRKGFEIRLDPVPRSYACPLRAIRKALAAGHIHDPDASLFQSPAGDPVTRAQLQALIRAEAVARGRDPARFTGHSMRIGMTNLLLGVGFPLVFIQHHGHWVSDAITMYIRKSFARIPRPAPGAQPDERYPCRTAMRSGLHYVDLTMPDSLCEQLGEAA